MWDWIQSNVEWVFSGVGVAAASAIAALLYRRKPIPIKPNASEGTNVSINVGQNAEIKGNVAGRDIVVVSIQQTKDRLEELARICELRADKIRRELSSHYKYTNVNDWIVKFNELHQQHVRALRAGRIIEAHELLLQIHKQSYLLECNEVSTRLACLYPGKDYAMSSGFGERGPMIAGYVAGQVKRDSEHYPITVDQLTWQLNRPFTEEKLLALYEKVFQY